MSSYVIVAPEAVFAASADVAGIGQAVRAASAAAAAATTQFAAAVADEISASIAALFGTHAADYHLSPIRLMP